MRGQAIEMNSDYASKSILKAGGRTDTSAAFDKAVHDEYDRIDTDFINDMNDQGFKRGGRDFTNEDLMEFRNKASAGWAP